MTNTGSNIIVDWSAFTPPVAIEQYVMQRCSDLDGDTTVFSCEGGEDCQNEFFEEACESVEGCSWTGTTDGVLEYETCSMVIAPNSFYLGTSIVDDYELFDCTNLKYTFYVHYLNNNYWGSAHNAYYHGEQIVYVYGDITNDGIINVIDIVSLVGNVLGTTPLEHICAADLNGDGITNVIDIVSLVGLILS